LKRLIGLFALTVTLAAWSPMPLFAQSTAQNLLNREGVQKNVPIHIVSDRMVADNKNKWVHFIGNVTTTRGDMVIHSDRLEVYRDENQDKIQRIEAIGRVDISQKSRYATADKAIYYDTEQKIVLLGNPKAWENDNIIVGHKMNFFLKTDQLIVEGNSNKRVDVVLYPNKEKDLKQIRPISESKERPAPRKASDGKTPAKRDRAP
jgi:lipopolysaccharide export system protein LptA